MSKTFERKSIRKYDKHIKIDQREMNEILRDATFAPSSMNMQPWRFVVVSSDLGKERLKPSLYGNHLQLETSAAMICIFTDLKKYEYAEKIYQKAVEKGLMPEDVKEKQLRNITNMIDTLDEHAVHLSGLIDSGLVAMQLMLVAKKYGYDTCPIGGFNHETLAKTVGLDEKRYKPVMIISIGKADEKGYESVRLDIEDITTFL